MTGQRHEADTGALLKLLSALAILCAMGSGWIGLRSRALLETHLLTQTQLIADAIHGHRIAELRTHSDLFHDGVRLRLEQHLAACRILEPEISLISIFSRDDTGTLHPIATSGARAPTDTDALRRALPRVAVAPSAGQPPNERLWGPIALAGRSMKIALHPIAAPKGLQPSVILAIAVDEAELRTKVLRRATVPLSLWVGWLGLLSLVGFGLKVRRNNRQLSQPEYGPHPTTVTIFALGTSLSLLGAWWFYSDNREARTTAFARLATDQSDSILERLRSLRDVELLSLARFFETNEMTSNAKFERFADFLTANPIVSAWEWAPAVEPQDRTRFEQAAQLEGLPTFAIWQKGENGQRVAVTENHTSYPVLHVAPLKGNEPALGYDLASDTIRRLALEEAQRTHLPTATAPIQLVQEQSEQKSMLFMVPALKRPNGTSLKGVVVAVARLRSILEAARRDARTDLELSLLTLNQPIEPLAQSQGAVARHPTEMVFRRPAFAFGKTFAITAYPRPEFFDQVPNGAVYLLLVCGLLLTFGLMVASEQSTSRRMSLQKLMKQKTRALHESEQRLRFALDATGDGVWDYDIPHGRVRHNERWCEILGLDKTFLEHPLEAFVERLYQQDKERVMAAVQACIEGNAPYTSEHRMIRVNGDVIWVLDRGKVVERDKEGRATRMVGSVADITEQLQAENALRGSEAKQELAMSLAQLAYWEYDVDSGLFHFDEKFYALYGTTTEREGGPYMTAEVYAKRFLPADETQIVATELERALSTTDAGYTRQLEHRIRRDDGTLSFILVRFSIVKDATGKTIRLFGANQDITRHKLAEAMLISANLSLQEASQRANRLAHQAEMASVAKSEFLANMSHEIRTPMNGIIGMSELLLDSKLTEKQKSYAEVIRSSSTALLGILNDILDLSKVEAGKLEFEILKFDIRVLVHEVIAANEFATLPKDLALLEDIEANVPPYVRGARERLRQVLTNLTSNAVKFTERGTVTIRVVLLSETDAEVTLKFEVKDTGIGIPLDKQDLLFQKFSQVDASTTRKFGGTGLGLAICKQIVHAMGGSIGVTSTPNEGSVFWFTVEFEKPSLVPSLQPDPAKLLKTSQSSERKPKSRPAKLLLAEDNEVNQVVAVALLEKLGILADIANSGTEALSRLSERDYDLVLMDVQMPDLDGFEATEQIRSGAAGEKNRKIPIVAMTAHAMQGDRERCLAAGMDDYVTKPIRYDELARAIARWL